MDKIEPYEPLIDHGSGLFTVDSQWEESPFGRRMTVVVTPSKNVIIHSAVRMNDEDMKKIDALGTVSVIIAPNIFHDSEAGWYATRYPKAKLFVPEKKLKTFQKKFSQALSLDTDWNQSLNADLEKIAIKGTRLAEFVFFHRQSKTLVVTDLVFNFKNDFSGFTAKIMKWNNAVNRFGPTNIFRWVFLKNKKELAESAREISKWDFERVVMSHGHILKEGGAKKFKEAFTPIVGSLD